MGPTTGIENPNRSTHRGVLGRVRGMLWPVVPRRMRDARWHRHPEPLGQQPQVVAAGGAHRVAEKMTDLQLGGQPATLPPPSPARAGPPPGRVGPLGARAKPCPAVALLA